MAKSHPFQVDIEWTGVRHGTTKSYASYSREFTISSDGKQNIVCSSNFPVKCVPNVRVERATTKLE